MFFVGLEVDAEKKRQKKLTLFSLFGSLLNAINSCVVLHLAATQALQHAAGNPPHFAQWHFGLVVALLSLGLAQFRNLAHMSKLLAAGTAAQLFAVSVVMATLITKPDRKAPPTKLFENHGWVRTSVAVLNVFFAYGGEFRRGGVLFSLS